MTQDKINPYKKYRVVFHDGNERIADGFTIGTFFSNLVKLSDNSFSYKNGAFSFVAIEV